LELYIERIRARGHKNIRATHRSTLEVTREDSLTQRGDCIVAVSADKALRDIAPEVRGGVRRGWPVAVVIEAGGFRDYSLGWGDPGLELSDPVRIVVRKSSYISPNTLAVRASKAAADLDRRLVEILKRGWEVSILVITSPRVVEILGLLEHPRPYRLAML